MGRIIRCETDSPGLSRWSTTLLTGKRHRKIAIINAYQVCQTTINQCGLNTCFAQQWHLLRSQGTKLPDPQRQFWLDLTRRYIKSLQNNHFLIVLTGDLNTSISAKHTNPITTLQESCDLSDAISTFHDCSRSTSYSRGNSIIDYCFISRELIPCVKASGYLPLHFFCFSDHRGMYIDFDSSLLFGSCPPKIPKPTARFVNSRDTQSTSKFLQRLRDYWTSHSLCARITKLSCTASRTHQRHPIGLPTCPTN